MSFNQHFCKKNIEAAIRTAFVNPNVKIYINGERSKKRYNVVYSPQFNEILLEVGERIMSWAYTTEITKTQKSKKVFVGSVTDVFYDVINGKIKTAA